MRRFACSIFNRFRTFPNVNKSHAKKTTSPLLSDLRCLAFSSSADCIQVTVLGASGGIGQPLSLLLKLSPLISELHLVDVAASVIGIATDLSHIDTTAVVQGYSMEKEPSALQAALEGSQIVIIPAGVPRKPGMSRDDLFTTNALIVRDLVAGCAKACPTALIGVISNPINSTLPIAAEVMKTADKYDPRRLFGITSLDLVRASTFVAAAKDLEPSQVQVPVIGGHAGKTIIPVLSQTCPSLHFDNDQISKLTHRIQEAGTEVVEAKRGTGSATLSMAYAAARFTFSLCKALKGESNVYEWAFVQSDIVQGVPFFSSKVLLGKDGIVENLGIGSLNNIEQESVAIASKELMKSINKGIEFVKKGHKSMQKS